MKYLASSLLVFAFLEAQAANAQNTPVVAGKASSEAPVDPQKAEIIRQIITASGGLDVVKEILNATMPQTIGVLRQNSLFSTAFLDEAQAKLNERFRSVDLVQLVVPIYAENFTPDELQQILAFEQSPIGQKMARLQPAMYAEMTASARAKGRQIGMEVTREILAGHPEYAQQGEETLRSMQSQAASPTSSPEGSVYKIGNGVVAPVLISKQEPRYTKQALDAKLNGSVQLSLVIDKDGIPRDVQVVRSLGLGLDEKAVEAVQSWHFKPATKDGKAVATRARVEVNFRLARNPQ